MSFIEDAQPVAPKTKEQFRDRFSSAPPEKNSLHENSHQQLAASDSALKESDQELSDSGEALTESDRTLVESDIVLQESDRALLNSGLELLESDRSLAESDQSAREEDHALRETDQSLRVADRALRATDQVLRASRRAMIDNDDLFQLLVDSVTDYAIYMLDPEGHVVTWNTGAERSKGYKAEEVLGKHFSIFFLPEDAEAGLPADELATAESQGRYESEAWRRRKDGSKFWALVTLTAVRDKSGELRGFAKVTRDMTAHKAAEEATRAANAQLERYRLIVGSVADYVIFTLNAEGKIDSWSAGAQNIYGYTVLETLGQGYSLVFSEADRESGVPQRELEEAARVGHCTTDDWRVRKDGTHIWVSGALTAVRDEAGKLTGFIRVARDMTAQKEAEEKLKNLNAELERYRIMVESIADYAIYTLDAEGRVNSWGSGAMAGTGWPAEAALGQHYSWIATEEDKQAGLPEKELEEAEQTGCSIRDGWRIGSNGVPFWSSGVLTAVRDETGKLTGYIQVARDITGQKRLEESLARLTADLEQRVVERTRELEETVAELQRKNQEVEAFVHIVSHDLRAPLVNVQGFVRELEESCKNLRGVIQACPQWESCWPGIQPVLEDEIGGALHYISASTTKFERLINALLLLSRQGRQVYQQTRVNVWELATNSVATFQQLITEVGAEVEIGALPSATADATALGQVFSNLIGNAIKYRSPQRSLRIEIGGQVEEGIVHYWVCDNGLGIPEYGKDKLFQVFQRFHRQQAEGEGMGLAIAHRIIERLGGKIWAESQEGEGTTFHFSLPANAAIPLKAG